MARPDKAATVAEISDRFRTSSAAVLTEYRGLSVSQLSALRKSISGHATYAVVMNTLSAIAAELDTAQSADGPGVTNLAA